MSLNKWGSVMRGVGVGVGGRGVMGREDTFSNTFLCRGDNFVISVCFPTHWALLKIARWMVKK